MFQTLIIRENAFYERYCSYTENSKISQCWWFSFKERVKIVTVNFNDLAESQSHKGAQAGAESVMDYSVSSVKKRLFVNQTRI